MMQQGSGEDAGGSNGAIQSLFNATGPCHIPMQEMKPSLLALTLAATAIAATPAGAERPRDQDVALRGLREGGFRPLREIEARTIRQMPGATYLGPELDAERGRYRLKFMRGGQVIWIDIDARTGQEVGRSGS
jgi:uncharacterized membrane protein YkoI